MASRFRHDTEPMPTYQRIGSRHQLPAVDLDDLAGDITAQGFQIVAFPGIRLRCRA